jgi:hypothetical protein
MWCGPIAIDPDLVVAAAELASDETSTSRGGLREALAAIPEREKAELLLSVVDGDARVAAKLKRRVRDKNPLPAAHRTAGTLRMRAREIAEARERAEAERLEAERRREAAEAEKARRARASKFSSNAAPAACGWRSRTRQ